MVVREPMRMRKAVLAGAVAVALTGTGAALAWSDASTPSPSAPPSSQPQPGNSGNAPGQNKPGKAGRGQLLHGEAVARKPDGTYQTVLEQNGTVESVSSSAITVKSDDGFSQTYTVNGDTKVTRIPAAATNGATASPSPSAGPGGKSDDGKRLRPADGTIADIAVGDAVRMAGVKDGDKATATRIVKGAGDGPGLGLGRGLEHAPGLKHAPGLRHGKGMGRGNGNDDQGA